jgi:heme-degrading monooxygenase HmoA
MEGSGLSRSVLPASANYAQAKKGRTVMAYIHFAKSEGQSIESFRMVSARHNPPQEIDGLLAWAAGTDENGLNVVTVWESEAHKDRWTAEQLFPVFQALGLADVPANTEFTDYNADEFYIR